MYELAVMEEPPLRIVLGSDALGQMSTKMEQYGINLRTYEHIPTSTDAEENEKQKQIRKEINFNNLTLI